MLNTAIAEQPVFDFQILPALGRFFKGLGALFYEKEQPVEVEYVDSKSEGSSFDRSHYAFYRVRFLGENVEAKDRERFIVADISPLKDGIERFSRGCAHFLHSFDPQTLKYEIVAPHVPDEPMPAEEGRARRRWQSRQLDVISDAIREQEVPSWLFPKFVEADMAHMRKGCNRTLAKRRAEDSQPKNKI